MKRRRTSRWERPTSHPEYGPPRAECGLDFVAVGEETFDLALPRDVYFRALFRRLVDSLKSEEVHSAAAKLGGYDLAVAGRLVWSAP